MSALWSQCPTCPVAMTAAVLVSQLSLLLPTMLLVCMAYVSLWCYVGLLLLQGLARVLTDILAQSFSPASKLLQFLEHALTRRSAFSAGDHSACSYSCAGLPSVTPIQLHSSLLCSLQRNFEESEWPDFEQRALAPCTAWLVAAAQHSMERVLSCNSSLLPQNSLPSEPDSASVSHSAATMAQEHMAGSSGSDAKSSDTSTHSRFGDCASVRGTDCDESSSDLPWMMPYVKMIGETTPAWYCLDRVCSSHLSPNMYITD